jgi:ABC-type glycerol-3-phosphate transport system permease component
MIDRVGRYIASRGWAHAVLLAGVGVFLLPFAWMLAMSLKTDEETTSDSLLPSIPTFRARSPYVRDTPAPKRPSDVTSDQWEEKHAVLESHVSGAVRRTTLPLAAKHADASKLRDAATRLLSARIVEKLDAPAWAATNEQFLASADAFLTHDAVAGALLARLGRIEIQRVQLKPNVGSVIDLCAGDQIARTWKVESGPGELFAANGITYLRYDFGSPGAEPIVLRYDFVLPATAVDFHKLAVTHLADDSWHRIDARVQIGATTWRSARPTHVCQHRPASIVYQPPGFDDTTYRNKTWISLTPDLEINRDGSYLSSGNVPAVLWVTISPSSTVDAVVAKLKRNYQRAFLAVPFWTYVGNSLLLVALQLAGSLFSASFVAYAFARLNWPGRSVALAVLLSTMMLPGQVTMVPLFMIWRWLGWYNTLNPLWVPAFFGSAFFIFLMTQHMKTIPRELEEAARLDGLNSVQTWWYVILPQVKPVLAAIAVMVFMAVWNDFMGPLIMLRDQGRFPLSLGLFGVRLEHTGDWSLVMAGNVLMTLPVVVIFFLFQRYFIQGVTMSGIKG